MSGERPGPAPDPGSTGPRTGIDGGVETGATPPAGEAEGPVTASSLHRWSEALAAIARTGLGFTASGYEAERYEEILEVAADIRAAADDLSDERTPVDVVGRDDLRASWVRAVGAGVPGYVTPKVAVGAVVGDDRGRMLLIQRSDSGVWLYPTGWADVGYSPAEVAVKEVREETGIRCRVERPLAIIDGLRAGFSRVPLYSLVFLCRAEGGTLSPHPQECLDAGWFTEDELPAPLANYDRWGRHAFDAIAGRDDRVVFDHPRDPVWRHADGR